MRETHCDVLGTMPLQVKQCSWQNATLLAIHCDNCQLKFDAAMSQCRNWSPFSQTASVLVDFKKVGEGKVRFWGKISDDFKDLDSEDDSVYVLEVETRISETWLSKKMQTKTPIKSPKKKKKKKKKKNIVHILSSCCHHHFKLVPQLTISVACLVPSLGMRSKPTPWSGNIMGMLSLREYCGNIMGISWEY